MIYVALFFGALLFLFVFGSIFLKLIAFVLQIAFDLVYVVLVGFGALLIAVVCELRGWARRRSALATPTGCAVQVIEPATYEIVRGGE